MRRENSYHRKSLIPSIGIRAGLVVMVLCLLCADAAQAEVVVFPDKNLEAAIRKAINKPTGNILDTDLVGTEFTALVAEDADITDLTGLEYCQDLTLLYLPGNKINDVSALARLIKLENLTLFKNQISDFSALAGLTNLKHLHLNNNEISDVSGVTGLPNLDELHLASNQISNFSALAGLTNLSRLELSIRK